MDKVSGRAPSCTKCSSRAVLYQPYSGMHLCARHFVLDVERKIKRRLRKSRAVESGDRIAVAISGGKDSSSVLLFLSKLLENRRDVELVALAVDEGITDFRVHTLKNARTLAGECEVPLEVVSFEKEYGTTLDMLVGEDKKGCTYCGVMRKRLLNLTARRLGATKLATGHNLDDEAQSVLLNYLKGDTERLCRLSPTRYKEGLIPRIKPLCDVPERETALYAHLHGIELEYPKCPYAKSPYRAILKRMLNELEYGHPGTKYALLKGYERLMELLPREPFELTRCSVCGEPSVGVVCKACELLVQTPQSDTL
ncbi:MAG: TIGR00269 family protein [Methermicoccaceae archaeon]